MLFIALPTKLERKLIILENNLVLFKILFKF